MSKIDYQALREAAERATPAMERLLMLPVDDDLLSEQELKDYGVDIDALNAFKFLAGPETVLALLDERERNQQYIKRRDQENEEIALTVGRLLIENGQLVADTLRHLADNEIDSDYFAITSTNENGTEIDHEMAITDYALQAAGTVDELVAALESAEKRIAELEAEPVSQTYNLPELIDGMEVSIDVSTCDADLGNRYFGTVTEALELDTAKNGYILLVQDAEPNFDVNGSSPVTQDGWISCSERMPEKNQNVLISVNFDSSLVEPLICSARYTGSTFRRGDVTVKPGNGIEQATHWMPLPEPPQKEKGRSAIQGKADNQPAPGNQVAEFNSGNEWTGNPDIDNAIIMLDRIDTLESCDDDRIEAVKAVLRGLAGSSPVTPDSWISRFEEMPDPSSEKRVCAFTPTNHEDMRYRFVPASLFKTVCRDATHWFYMLPPVGREEVAGG